MTAWTTTTDYEGTDPMTLDANAVAGMLTEIFGAEMTAARQPVRPLRQPRPRSARLRAYTHASGSRAAMQHLHGDRACASCAGRTAVPGRRPRGRLPT